MKSDSVETDFQLEEMLWLRLQSYLRDQGDLRMVTQQAKHDRMQAWAEEFSDSSEEESDSSSDSSSNEEESSSSDEDESESDSD